jgi:hypothetical protein
MDKLSNLTSSPKSPDFREHFFTPQTHQYALSSNHVANALKCVVST